jgi:protein involved in polysaccharide export with SLBB domain
MKKVTLKNIVLTIIILSSLAFSASNMISTSIPGQEYYTDETGNVYIYINVIGHVNSPGTYIIYEGTDVLTILAQAGGPLPGAKLNKAIIYRKNADMIKLNIESHMKTGQPLDIEFKPNDTIFIEQSFGSYMMTKTNILNSFLQILNLSLTISRY